MLSYLKIKNVALIDELTIDFDYGFNVLTGETGAGKSIIIDSLNFVLGGKVNKTMIRHGQPFMRVEALFVPPYDDKVLNVLQEYDIEPEEEILVVRTYHETGKNEIKLNGNTVTVSMLKNISINLVDILGQHEHQSLLKEKFHLTIIDNLKPKAILAIKDSVADLYLRYKDLLSQIDAVGSSSENRERMLDLLSYQINEIEKAALKDDEDIELVNERLKMLNSEKIAVNLNNAYGEINSNYNGSVQESLKKASNYLTNISQYEPALQPLIERIDSARYEIVDIAETLQQINEQNSFDQDRFDKIDARLDYIKTLKKKYGSSTQEINAFLQKIKKEYDDIVNSEELLNKLSAQLKQVKDKLYNESIRLSQERKTIAKELESLVKGQLVDLGMKNARFEVVFDDILDIENAKFSSNGLDNVHFEFSANMGQALKPLSEVISGGEMSRFMLGIKNILADIDNINTLVFDEIDTGISGNIGFTIACKMANIAKQHQIISVSHLPQIAAMADQNYLITKNTLDGQTYTYVEKLSEDGALYEVARLAGGEKTSEVSLKHAKELKQRCVEYKQSI